MSVMSMSCCCYSSGCGHMWPPHPRVSSLLVFKECKSAFYFLVRSLCQVSNEKITWLFSVFKG